MRNVLLAALLFAGCGMGARDAAEYEAAVDALEATVTEHQSQGDAILTPAECTAEHARYDAAARERVRRLNGMGMRRPFGVGSMCSSMTSELDVHARQACGGDATVNRAETRRHCQAMLDWLARAPSLP